MSLACRSRIWGSTQGNFHVALSHPSLQYISDAWHPMISVRKNDVIVLRTRPETHISQWSTPIYPQSREVASVNFATPPFFFLTKFRTFLRLYSDHWKTSYLSASQKGVIYRDSLCPRPDAKRLRSLHIPSSNTRSCTRVRGSNLTNSHLVFTFWVYYAWVWPKLMQEKLSYSDSLGCPCRP